MRGNREPIKIFPMTGTQLSQAIHPPLLEILFHNAPRNRILLYTSVLIRQLLRVIKIETHNTTPGCLKGNNTRTGIPEHRACQGVPGVVIVRRLRTPDQRANASEERKCRCSNKRSQNFRTVPGSLRSPCTRQRVLHVPSSLVFINNYYVDSLACSQVTSNNIVVVRSRSTHPQQREIGRREKKEEGSVLLSRLSHHCFVRMPGLGSDLMTDEPNVQVPRSLDEYLFICYELLLHMST